jgi:hypothetical protein
MRDAMPAGVRETMTPIIVLVVIAIGLWLLDERRSQDGSPS